MKKIIATHKKIMHADEITAIALLKVFTNDEIEVKRIEHSIVDFTDYDMVIDIGKKFDGIKYFDHHQYKGGKSSAGLIWDYIGLSEEYPKISKLVHLIDMNDVGIQKAKAFEYSSLIKCFNAVDIYSQEQDIQFDKAVEFAQTILRSMKNLQEETTRAKQIISNSSLFYTNPKIIELAKFTPHWGNYINGEVNSHIKAVVWEDLIEGNWKVRIPSIKQGSFELNGNRLLPDSSMEFVHSSGHFAVSKSQQQMNTYLEKFI